MTKQEALKEAETWAKQAKREIKWEGKQAYATLSLAYATMAVAVDNPPVVAWKAKP